jgi:hypothetical protein
MSARDVIVISLVLTGVALVAITAFLVSTQFKDAMTSNPLVNQSVATMNVLNDFETKTHRFDTLVVALFIGLTLATIISSWLIAGNALFMFIYFILIVLGIITSAVLNNIYVKIVQTNAFSSINVVTYFPFTDYLMSNLPYFVAVIGFIGLIMMFAKPALSGGGELR